MASPTPSSRHYLLSSSLKLRNVQSISLRNLRLSQSSSTRNRGITFDDDALPQTLSSPAKLLALREDHALGHSRSSSDLRESASEENGQKSDGKRPQVRRLRRRSTLEWANATPQSRQSKLEDMIKGRMGHVFFSLHVHGVEGWS
jgi:hypothetical protein